MTDKDFMREALKEAAAARDAGDWAIGAVITLNNKIVARGRNRVYSTRNRLMHAEVAALPERKYLPSLEITNKRSSVGVLS